MSLVKQIAIESEGVTTNYDIGVNVANVDGLGAPTTSRAGLVPALPNDGLTNKYLRQDGTWAEAAAPVSYEIFMLTGTLAAAATSVSITDSRLGANTFILGPNTSTGIAPTAITVNDSTHTQTATFAAPESAVTVAIVCFNFSS